MSDNRTTLCKSEQICTKATGVLSVLALFLLFLLPLKFGIITGLPEVSNTFPATIVGVILISWPPMLFSIFSAMLLLGVLLCTKPLEYDNENRLLLPLSWVLLFISVLPGFLNASMFDFAIIQTALFAGYAAFCLVIYRLIMLRPDLKIWFLNAIVLSTVIVVFMGLEQYLYGFKTTLAYIYKQEQETGVKFSSAMMSRLLQTRVFTPFSICNSLAAHLILTIPICIWGILKSKFILKSVAVLIGIIILFMASPPATSRPLFMLIVFCIFCVLALLLFRFPEKKQKYISLLFLIAVIGLILFVLRYTYSRGAFLGLGAASFFFIMLTPIKPKYKISVAALILVGSFFMITSDLAERSLASMNVRFDYYKVALKIFFNHPLFGTGWGDFFHEYTKIKAFPGDEAPHMPHNMILSFASQAGLFGLLSAIMLFTTPFYIFFRKFKNGFNKVSRDDRLWQWLNVAIITGWAGWAIHSLIDFNIQIPGTVATAITMLLIMNASKLNGQEAEEADVDLTRNRSKLMLLLWYGIGPLIALIAVIASIHQIRYEVALVRFNESANLSVFRTNIKKTINEEQLEFMLNDCCRLAPYSPIHWMNAAKYAEQNQKWGIMEKYLKEALSKSPERASLYYRLSCAQLQLGKITSARDNFRKAVELFPNAYKKKYEEIFKDQL